MAKAGNLAKHLFTNLTCQIHAVTTISETRALQHSAFHNGAKIILKLQLILFSYILFLHCFIDSEIRRVKIQRVPALRGFWNLKKPRYAKFALVGL